MKLEIIKQNEFPLLSRSRVSLWCDEKSATPSRKSLISEIAKLLKIKEDLVIIKHIYPQVGSPKSKILVHVYQDKAKMDFFENKSLLKKHRDEPKAPKKE
ncbi:MAG: hypothetical protein V1859_02715 [archaeon]